MIDTSDRHPGTQNLARWLSPNPKLSGQALIVVVDVESLASYMIENLPDGPELTAGLRHLLEAKDCFVRAALDASAAAAGDAEQTCPGGC